MYGSAPRKHCDLPLRLADFTALHRNERSGALSGLTRLRQFHQDDGHIFCRADQLDEEISSTLGMVRRLYRDVFGFPKYSLALSTRPQKFMGDPLVWEKAEEILKGVLNVHTKEHGLNEHALHEGDGAFYGIDEALVTSYIR